MDTVAAVDVSKRFGSLQALDRVSIQLCSGRVHAIVGENGAGKSTLAKVFAGLLRPDGGKLTVGGVVIRGTYDRTRAINLGIGYVPQQLSLVPTLTILENYFLSQRKAGFLLAHREGHETLASKSVEFGMTVPIEERADQLSLGERQLAEVLISLALGAQLLLLDEPTSALGPNEVEQLITQVRALAERGVGVMLVTHRLKEVLQAADEVTVLRAGQVVHTGRVGEEDSALLAERMVGHQVGPPRRPDRPSARVRLDVKGLVVHPKSGPAVLVDGMQVAEGEILGIAGVGGNGQSCFAESLVGLQMAAGGKVMVDGIDVTGNPAKAAALGVAYIPEDRHDGLVDSLSIMDNVSIGDPRSGSRHWGMRHLRPLMQVAADVCFDFDVRPGRPWLRVGGLSGGNQQKLMAGRELRRDVSVLVADGPTKGLDIAAAAVLRDAIANLARGGAAVVLISSELDEILALAHRVLVIYRGRMVDEFAIEEFDETRIGRAMAGLS